MIYYTVVPGTIIRHLVNNKKIWTQGQLYFRKIKITLSYEIYSFMVRIKENEISSKKKKNISFEVLFFVEFLFFKSLLGKTCHFVILCSIFFYLRDALKLSWDNNKSTSKNRLGLYGQPLFSTFPQKNPYF